jgi:hypothetical protein
MIVGKLFWGWWFFLWEFAVSEPSEERGIGPKKPNLLV